ncbi:DUF4258 domain-containing protein [Larkinella sp. VNQ87]|uniref:DUF4258 domain-containing protein n=1 Tax=Larkinella sp. VNQ87 TaxID=3400921 RepID=UPI003C07A934
MEFELSRHAVEQMHLRGISVESVNEVLMSPDKIISDGIGQVIYQAVVVQNGKNILSEFLLTPKRRRTWLKRYIELLN